VNPRKIGTAFTRAAGVLTGRDRPAGEPSATTLPSGAVCFLFTDIEGSTRLWEHHPEPMAAALACHDALLRDCVLLQGGVVAKTVGDGLLAAFPTAQGAVTAAFDGQLRLAAERWGDWGLPGPLRVRMALHAASVDPTPDGDYRSSDLIRLGQLVGAARGGQIVLSRAAVELMQDRLPAGASLRPLAERLLAEPTWILTHADLPALAGASSDRADVAGHAVPPIGRDDELGRLRDALRNGPARLLTVVGPPGVGKSRLALAAAAAAADAFPDGVWVIDCSAIPSADGLLPAVVTLLERRDQMSACDNLQDRLFALLRERRLLLVLDNLEHLLPGAARAVADLVAAGPGVRVLVTSRARTGARAEYAVPVDPLPCPDTGANPGEIAESPAVRLFTARAAESDPGFVLTAENSAAVAELCRRLDGQPLAIEAAAARTGDAALAGALPDPATLLDLPADPEHPQSRLRAAIDRSYDLLPENERTLFRRLAIFESGATLEAAEAICDPDGALGGLDPLERLVDQSLLEITNGPDGAPRVRMLETIRAYALQRLRESDDADAVRARHADLFLALISDGAPASGAFDAATWCERLDIEWANLDVALTWLVEHDPSRAECLASALDTVRDQIGREPRTNDRF
jgi:predicted ATPase/class 3 adenylate cyclase